MVIIAKKCFHQRDSLARPALTWSQAALWSAKRAAHLLAASLLISILVPMNFEELGLSPKTLKAIKESGYTEPTPIQAGAIPHVLAAQDVLGIAQTGTGKTASFTLPMIDILSRGRAKARMPRSLILEPTRELAAQVAENFEHYGKYHKLSMALLVGGVAFGEQNRKLTQGVDVLIATPGRLLDHIERGNILMNGVQLLVVDEADRMLDMGFIPDIERIFKLTPFTRQTLFFSATMPAEIQRIVDTFLHNPKRVEVARPTSTAATVEQFLIKLDRSDARTKTDALCKILNQEEIKNAIIFCNRKRDVDKVAGALKKARYNASPIHGDLPQSVRTETLRKFKEDELQLLIASDVAARGLDIPAVSHVFNYDVPIHAEDYIHRIGRTGRAGREGRAFTITTPLDTKALSAVHNLIGADLPIVGAKADSKAPAPAKENPKETKPAAEQERPQAAAQNSRPKRRKVRSRAAKPAAAAPETPNTAINKAATAPETSAQDTAVSKHAPAQKKRPSPAKAASKERKPGFAKPARKTEKGEPKLGFGNAMPNFFKRGD